MRNVNPDAVRLSVGIDLLYLRPNEVGGSETYVRELVSRLAVDPSLELVLYCQQAAARTMQDLGAERVNVIAGGGFSQVKRLVAQNIRLRDRSRRDRRKVMFAPGNFPAFTLPRHVGQVMTVHDLQHLELPQYFSRATRASRTLAFSLGMRRSHRVICISEFTRRGVADHFPAQQPKLVVVHEGATTPVPGRAVQSLVGWPQFMLFPAMGAPHKNHMVLLRALAILNRENSFDVPLCLTGKVTQYSSWLQDQARQLGVGHLVQFLGHVPVADLHWLLTESTALLYPSTFEGFGLPVLEAMRAGTPVIASNAASLPEVAGDGAVLLPPHDERAWAREMRRVVIDKDWRAELRERGIKWAQRFDWDRCASETATVLRTAARLAAAAAC